MNTINLILAIKYNPLTYWIFIIIMFILCILIDKYYPRFRELMGEFWLKKELEKLPKKEYFIINDIMLELGSKTYQIDHIVISKHGIFVIEMKNYYGLIMGNTYNKEWIQILGKHKYYFQNPIHQNYSHIKALSKLLNLPEEKFISIICFSNQVKLSINKNKNVTQLDFINSLILSYKENILDKNLREITTTLQEKNILDKEKRKKHVETISTNIKLKKELEYNMICPNCKSKLVEKDGRFGKFIGCSNYPKCKYKKQNPKI